MTRTNRDKGGDKYILSAGPHTYDQFDHQVALRRRSLDIQTRPKQASPITNHRRQSLLAEKFATWSNPEMLSQQSSDSLSTGPGPIARTPLSKLVVLAASSANGVVRDAVDSATLRAEHKRRGFCFCSHSHNHPESKAQELVVDTFVAFVERQEHGLNREHCMRLVLRFCRVCVARGQ